MQQLILIGGGELARVIIECADASGGWRILGFLDPERCEQTVERLGVDRLGTDDDISKFPHARFVLGVGTIKVSPLREQIVNRLSLPRDRWATIIHPAASVSPTSQIGRGVVILPCAVICTGAVICDHAIINLGAKIDHDVHVGKFVHVAPQAALGGGSRVEENCYIGMGAVVRDHTTVSTNTLVGMGAVVGKRFAPGETLIGVPAKPMAVASLADPHSRDRAVL